MADLLECQFTDVVSLSDAAGELGISVSTISRNVRDGIIPNRGSVRAPKVSIKEARAAREAHLDHGMSRRSPAPPAFNDYRAQLEKLKVEKTRMELAELQATLVPKAEVDEFMTEAGARFRDAFLRRWRTFAAELVGLTPREIEEKGRAMDESLLAALAAEFESQSF